MTDRIEIINELINYHGYASYLEIGVRNPDHCFNQINCNKKTSVDPCYEIIDAIVDFKYESDDFFKQLEEGKYNIPSTFKWDIIFIDGLHLSFQVERDILNSLKHLSPNGTIVLHDCYPPTLHHAREDFYDINTIAGGDWNGTVWKAFYKFRATRPDLSMYVVDTDWGVGVISLGNQICCQYDNPFFEYRIFEKNKIEHLNLISVDVFKKLMTKNIYGTSGTNTVL